MFLYLRESYTNKEKELNAIKLHKKCSIFKSFYLNNRAFELKRLNLYLLQ